VKATVFNLLGISVTNYGQAFGEGKNIKLRDVLPIMLLIHFPIGAQTTIIQDLQYWEHSAEPMAEFLQVLVLNHDHRQLSDEVLRDISNKVFKDNTNKELKDSPNSKTFAAFLIRMSELCPKVVLKNMGLLIGQLDSEVFLQRYIHKPKTVLETNLNTILIVLHHAYGHRRSCRQSYHRHDY
jgi:hypothetical protein